jgi:hypothetical protein
MGEGASNMNSLLVGFDNIESPILKTKTPKFSTKANSIGTTNNSHGAYSPIVGVGKNVAFFLPQIFE